MSDLYLVICMLEKQRGFQVAIDKLIKASQGNEIVNFSL